MKFLSLLLGCPLLLCGQNGSFHKTVLFSYGKSDITAEREKPLFELLDSLSRYDSFKIKVDGHTDNAGNNVFNLALSEKRCLAVSQFLMSVGKLPAEVFEQHFFWGRASLLLTKTK